MTKINGYMTIKEASELVGVCAMTLRRWERSGKLKSYRNPANNYRLYKEYDLKMFLKKLSKNKI